MEEFRGTERMEVFIATLFADPEKLRMGHAQRREDPNLGSGPL
jgi:hypothetical protein